MGFLGVLTKLSFAVLVASIGLAIFAKYAMQDCKNFKIDDQSGKVIFITGANSGLGFHTAVALAKANAKVIMACRSIKKCDEAKGDVLKEAPSAVVETIALDLASFSSIKSCHKTFKDKYGSLDVLINNAGIMALPNRSTTADDLEAQIGTNHFGHFLLTALLFPFIKNGGRIINHSSLAHLSASSAFPFVDTQSKESYSAWGAYGNSKLANLLFTFELNKRLALSGNPKNIISVAVHPGYTATNLQHGTFPFADFFNDLIAMSGPDGAQSQIAAAANADVRASNGTFIGPKYYMFGPHAVQPTSKASLDDESQRFLWEESVRITGNGFFGLVPIKAQKPLK